MKNISMRILFAFVLAVVMLVTVAVATTEYPPIEIRFDGDADAVTATRSLSNITQSINGGYLHLVGSSGDSDNVQFTLNAADYFDLYEYPYMKIKYKSTAVSNYLQFYIIANDESDASNYAYRFRAEVDHTSDTANTWQAPVRYLNGDIKNGIGIHGSANSIPTKAGDNFVKAFRFDMCRVVKTGTTVDLEYIAFFHTEEEALAYGNTCNEYATAIEDKAFAYDNAAITSKAQLIATLQADIDAMESSLNLGYDATAKVSVSDEQYAIIAANGFGSFGFDVTFSTQKSIDKTYTYSGNVVDTSVAGSITLSTISTIECGGIEFTLNSAIENLMGVTGYKWYMSNDAFIDENDTFIKETAVNYAEVTSPAQVGDAYYYVVAVTSAGEVASGPVKVNVTFPETVVVDMSTQSAVNVWLASNGANKNSNGKIPVVTDSDGVSHAHVYFNGSEVVNLTNGNISANITNRPYVVYRIRRNFTDAFFTYYKTTFLDNNSSLQYKHYGGMLTPSTSSVYPGDEKWHTVIRNMPEELKTYSTELKGASSGKFEWKSKLHTIMYQPSAKTAGNYIDFEFVAFAATEEEANKVGADYAAKLAEKKSDIGKALFTNGTVVAELTKIIGDAAALYGYTASDITASIVTEPTATADGKYTYSFKLSAGEYTYEYTNTALLKGEGTDAPIIWRFNNEDAIADWDYGKDFNINDSILKDGVMHTPISEAVTVSPHYLGGKGVGAQMASKFQFQRHLYPYFKVKYRQGNFMTYGQIYLDNASTYINFHNTPPKADEWATLAIDFSTTGLAGGTYGTGLMKSFSFWLRGKAAKDAYDEIEYIAFFPAGETGKLAWQNFDSKNPTVKGSSDEYIEGYGKVDGIAEAVQAKFDKHFMEVTDAASAKAIIENAIKETDSEVTYVISDGVAVDYGYKFNVKLSCGIDYKACFTKEIEIVVKKPAPIIYRFNTKEAAADWETGKNFNKDANGNAVNGTIVDGVLRTPVKFISGTVGLVNDHYLGTNAVAGTMPENLAFNYAEYPYLKIKYRHDGFVSGLQLYLNIAANRIDLTVPAANTWTTFAIDLSTANYAKDGAFPATTATSFGFWSWNAGNKTGYDEIEYIAFFPATEEGKAEWTAFDSAKPKLTGSSDAYIAGYDDVLAAITALEYDYKFETYPAVASIADAKAMVEKTITDALNGYDAEYTISAGEAVTDGYSFNVTLTAGNDYRASQYKTVSVTVRTKGETHPIIWRFNNDAAIADWSKGADYNAATNKPVLKDGVMHTTVSTGATHQISPHYLGGTNVGVPMPAALRFNREDYPYLKIKYRQGGFMSRGTVYLDNAKTHIALPSVPAKDAWTTVSYDFTAQSLNEGTYGRGTMNAFGIWLWGNNKSESYDEIEYVAFFPVGKTGKAAWQSFDSANPTAIGSSDAYIPGYDDMNAAVSALNASFDTEIYSDIESIDDAKAKIEATINNAITGNNVDYTISAGAESADGYSFTVNFTAGIDYRAQLTKTVDVNVISFTPVVKIGDEKFESLDEALAYAEAQAMTEVEITVLEDITFSTKVADFAKVTFTGTNREQTIDLNINSNFESAVALEFNDLTVSRLDIQFLYHYTHVTGGLKYNNCKMIGLFNVTAQDTDFIGCDFYNDDTFGDGNYSLWLVNCFEGVEVNVIDCTFDVYERAIKVYGDAYNGKMVLNISGTEFTSRTADKTVIEMAYDNGTGVGEIKLNITDSTANGFGAPEHIEGEANAWFNVEGVNTGSTVKVDGTVVYTDCVAEVTADGITEGYLTFEKAMEAAQNGATVKLLKDIAITERLDIADKALTINLGGKNITSTVDDSFGAIYVKKGATLTIEGEGNITSAGLTIGTYGTVNVNGGNIITESEDDASLYVFFYNSDFQGTATINGGALGVIWNCGNLTVNGGTVEYLDTSSELTVSGGTITEIFAQDGSDADGAYEITITDPSAITVPEGFELKEIEAGKYQVVKVSYVAAIGDAKYETLQAAFDAAQDGDIIYVIENITIELDKASYNDGTYVDGIRYTGDKSFTVDFGGFTVTDDGCVNDYLIYMNNKGEKANEITFTNGTIESKNGNWATVCVGSTSALNNTVLNLNGMTITNKDGVTFNGNQAVRARGSEAATTTVNVNNGTTLISDNASYAIAPATANSIVNINSGAKLIQKNTANNGGDHTATALGGLGIANVYAGAIIESDNYGIYPMTSGNAVVNVYGGAITAPYAVGAFTNGGEGQTTTINVLGGTFAGEFATSKDGKITITGGTFSSDLSAYLAHGYKLFENKNGTFDAEMYLEDVADADGDGAVTVSDAIKLLQYLATKK